VSEPALPDTLATGRLEIVEPPHPIAFDAAGVFVKGLA